MKYEMGAARSVQIEWQYGLTALANMIGFELPHGLHPQVINGHADWSEQFNTGRVLQAALPRVTTGVEEVDADLTPHYVRPGRSFLNDARTQRYTVQKERVGHPTILDEDGVIVQMRST